MDIISTPRELIDRGVWGDACRMLGINEYAINEGQMDSGEEVRLTRDQAAELGLIPAAATAKQTRSLPAVPARSDSDEDRAHAWRMVLMLADKPDIQVAINRGLNLPDYASVNAQSDAAHRTDGRRPEQQAAAYYDAYCQLRDEVMGR